MKPGIGSRVIPRRRVLLALAGVYIFASIFSASLTFFDSFQSLSTEYLGGEEDVVVLFHPRATTVFTGSVPRYLSEIIRGIPGVEAVSPEIISTTVSGDEPLTVRGVTKDFFSVQRRFETSEQALTEGVSGGVCLLGATAARRLGVSPGDRIVLESTMRETFKEVRVDGVYSTDTNLDDEALINIETARLLARMSASRVTVIRARVDGSTLDDRGLREIVSATHVLRVELNPVNESISTSTLVRVSSKDGQLVEQAEVGVPGVAEFNLTLGEYVVEASGVEAEVLLVSDERVSLDVEPGKKELRIRVFNATTNMPLVGASMVVSGLSEGGEFELETDEQGEASVFLQPGRYLVAVQKGAWSVEKDVDLLDQKDVTFNLGRVKLEVLVLRGSDKTPVGDAEVSVKASNLSLSGFTDASGRALFYVEPDLYNVSVSAPIGDDWRFVEMRSDPTVTFLLGSDSDVHSLSVNVRWDNGTIIRNAVINLEGEGVRLEAETGWDGSAFFSGLPKGSYQVFIEHRGVKRDFQVDLEEDREIDLVLGRPEGLDLDGLPARFVRYLPRDVAVLASEEVFENVMGRFTSLTRAALLSLLFLIGFAAVLNGWGTVSMVVGESGKIVGTLRALGAMRGETVRIVAWVLFLPSILVGVAGYLTGLGAVLLTAEIGVLSVGGYVFRPRIEAWAVVSTIGISVLVTLGATIKGALEAVGRSPSSLLRGIRSREILRIPSGGIVLPALVSFLVPLVVRAVPEVIMNPMPVGFDVLSAYIPMLKSLRGGLESATWSFVRLRPFFFTLASLPYPFDDVALLKVFPTLLHGALGLVSYLFAYRIFEGRLKALAASFLSTLYFVPLRVSWDLLANELGVVLLFSCLVILRDAGRRWSRSMLLLLFAMALVLSHELVSALLFLVAIPEAMVLAWRDRSRSSLKLLVPLLAALGLFLYRSKILGVQFFMNALGSPIYPSETVGELSSSVLIFSLFCFLPLLPFVLLGIARVRRAQSTPSLLAWLISSLGAALSPIFSPGHSLVYWARWAWVTWYPLAFLTVIGVSSLGKVKAWSGITLDLKALSAVLITVIVAATSIGFVYYPSSEPFWYYDHLEDDYHWMLRLVPPSMNYNTFHGDDARDIVEAIDWLNSQGVEGVLIVDKESQGFASLYLDESRMFWYSTGVSWFIHDLWMEGASQTASDFKERGLDVYLLGPYYVEVEEFQVIYKGKYAAISKLSY